MTHRVPKDYEPHFPVRSEFNKASYLDRYRILCQKLILERHYASAALLWTSDANTYGDLTATRFASLVAAKDSLIKVSIRTFAIDMCTIKE